MKNKRIFMFILVIGLATAILAGEADLLKKAKSLFNKGKYKEVILLLENAKEQTENSEKLLVLKTNTLLKLQNHKAALLAAQQRVAVAKRKSPWHCIAVAEVAMKLKNSDLVFQWLDKAVERGFLNHTALEAELLTYLKKDPRFKKILEKINKNIGIGQPVKEFGFPLLAGENFHIKEQKGKVVLIDFWATWCPPCVKGIPHLKEFYVKYKAKGLEIIGISLDSKRKLVVQYVQKEKLAWKIGFSGEAWMDKTARLFNVNLIPSYWLIDREGILRDFGYHLRDEHNLEKSIQKLLAE